MCLLVALAMLASACSKPKGSDGGSDVSAKAPKVKSPVVAAGGDQTTTTAAAAAAAAKPGAAAPGVQPKQAGAPGAGDEAQARAVGALVKPESTEKKSEAPGVTDTSIKLVFGYDPTSCGVNVTNALTAAGGALPTTGRFYRAAPTQQNDVVAENKESMDTIVKYWNEHATDQIDTFPAIKDLTTKFNTPGHPFYGRKLDYELVDSGSNQCPEKTTAAAKAAIEKNAFVVFNSYDGAQYNMAAALNAAPENKRPMHFGTLWLSDQDYTRFAPYAWTEFATGSTITRQFASYICSRVNTGIVPSRSPEMVKDPKKRVFGLLHTNVEQDVRLVNEFKSYLKQDGCGSIIKKEIAYDGTDFGKAQQDNPNVVVQMKLAGVTSVIMLTEPIQPLFQMQIAQQQNYHPEWLYSSFGFGDTNTVQRLYDQKQTKNSFGISQLGVYGGFGFGAGDPFKMYHSLHQTAPDGKPCDPSSEEGMSHGGNAEVEHYCKAPTSLVLWYYSTLAGIAGMLFAGPDLTAARVSAGLQHYPTTRYGGNGPTSDPRPALVGSGEGKYGFVVDAAEWRWHPEYTSPQPENKAGFVEYPDCMRHYIDWPDALAPNWEKDGPNWSAWCGDPKTGYPRVLPEDSNG
jgi:hypothetical protein